MKFLLVLLVASVAHGQSFNNESIPFKQKNYYNYTSEIVYKGNNTVLCQAYFIHSDLVETDIQCLDNFKPEELVVRVYSDPKASKDYQVVTFLAVMVNYHITILIKSAPKNVKIFSKLVLESAEGIHAAHTFYKLLPQKEYVVRKVPGVILSKEECSKAVTNPYPYGIFCFKHVFGNEQLKQTYSKVGSPLVYTKNNVDYVIGIYLGLQKSLDPNIEIFYNFQIKHHFINPPKPSAV